MTIALNPKQKLDSFSARKKVGLPNGFGDIVFGYSQNGEDNPFAGIYQRKKTLFGYKTSKMKFYRPPLGRTPAQDLLRLKFSAACSGWNDLTNEEKAFYNEKGKKLKLYGRSVYISEFMKA